jgi:hypothetical protein
LARSANVATMIASPPNRPRRMQRFSIRHEASRDFHRRFQP